MSEEIAPVTGEELEVVETPQETQKQIDTPEETPEQLRAKIATLEREKADVTRESIKHAKNLKAFEKAQDEAKKAEMSELEKAQAELKETRDQLAEKDAIATRHTVLSEMRKIGQKLELSLNEDALSDLYDAGKFAGLELSEAETFLKDLIKTKPYLLQNKVAAPDIHSQSRNNGGLNEFDEVRKKAEERQASKAGKKSWMEQAGVVVR